MNQYSSWIKQYFYKQNKYMLGQELNERIQKKFGVTAVHARKIIQRAVEDHVIKSSAPVTFGKGQYVYCYYKSVLHKRYILEIAEKERPPVFRLLTAIEKCNGVISFYEALKITASPLDGTKTKMDTLSNILDDLSTLRLVKVINHEGIKFIVEDYMSEDHAYQAAILHKANMELDCALLPDMLRWLTLHNFIDNQSYIYRNKTFPSKGAEQNNFVWDAYAYTKVTGYNTVNSSNQNTENKQMLVVLDMVIHREYDSMDVQGLYNRLQGVLHSSKNKRKVLPIVITRDISIFAAKQLKSLGFLHFGISTIYGERILEIITSLKRIKHLQLLKYSESDQLTEFVANTLLTMEESGQEGNLQNIKGDLFEVLLYPLIKALYPNGSIESNKIYKDVNEEGSKFPHEFDAIVIDRGLKEAIVFELKGHKSSKFIPKGPYDKRDTVKWFFNNTLLWAKKHLENENPHFKVTACYMTTAQFTKDAVELLESYNQGDLKPKLAEVYYDGYKLLQLAESRGLDHINKILRKHYINKSDFVDGSIPF
ncbi:hypothetical protein HQN90_14490 [Paenibacillus alba]|uniref:hypothetical protein n=1 Tax=Paenibacillus alba TaxID=1197127 RepID=UPI00156715CB|nr:hypothetical protein [Paenibacillus alba]NQX67326.1 hypothetical protein [Paenibacillus alba]